MKFNPLRRKPDWQSPDPATRARGVAEAPLAEIAPHLAELLRADESPVVRRAAIGRADDLALLADRMRNDGDRAVRDAARQRYRSLLAGPDQPVSERARVLALENDQDVLAHVATEAGEAALRRVALERIARPGLLVERCQRDSDPDIRLWLLSRVDAPASLARIAEAARKGDKLLARAARERLEALKLAAGDPATLRARCLDICDTVSALRRDRPVDFETRHAALAQEWSALRDRVDEALARRVDGYFKAFEPAAGRSAPIEAEPEPATVAAAPEPAPEIGPEAPPVAPEPTPEDAAAALASRAREDASDAAREARRSARAVLAEALAALEHALGEGQLSAARVAYAALAVQREAVADPGRQLLARIATADEAYAKLAHWQHWSNNKVRARLCADIEALAGAGMHPDGVAAKVKDTQLAWQRLDESEALGPKAAETGIAKRFRSACHRALAPTRKYFEKRRELRDGKREQVDALLSEADRQLAADPRAAPALRRRLVEALQHLDEVEPRARGELGRSLRAMLTRIDAAQAERANEAEAAKRKLVANLRREVARAPLADAIEKAKLAQAEWARLGRAPREAEAALAQELHALIDPFFQQAGAKRAAEAEARSAGEAEARAILTELAALAADPAQAAHADPRLAALTQRWRALPRAAQGTDRDRGNERGVRNPLGMRGSRDDNRGHGRELRREPKPRDPWDERAFDRAIDRVREAQGDVARSAERTLLAALREAAAICARIEDGGGDRDAVAAAYAALSLPADARDTMRARLDAALAADGVDVAETRAANGEAGAILAASAELVAGVESSDDAKPLRRRLQLERLAERMRGGATLDPPAELRAILLEWCALGPLEPAVREALATRVYSAFDAPGPG
jgi:hypothetical protein